MKRECFVGFDTSNYTTSVSVCDAYGKVIANLKTPLPVLPGERGLRQSDAVFAHIKNLPELCDRLSRELGDFCVAGVGVSARPRSVEGSYMPCFLSGIAAAHAFAAAVGVPVTEFSHQDGHVMAALYSSGAIDELLGKEFLAFHVSGGTTEMLLARPNGYSFTLELVGQTADINAGQLIDRVGVMMGIDFPCGRELERFASEFDGKVAKSRVVVRENNDMIECNLSGIENISKNMYEKDGDKSAVAAYVFACVRDTLCRMAHMATEKYGDMPIVFAGGVMSNKLMRSTLSKNFRAYFAEPEFSADNAAGISLLCREKIMKK